MTMSQVISQVETPSDKAIDREKVCPLLLRIFYSNLRHNPISDYSRGSVPTQELQIYTWMDCTLRELMLLIKDVNPDTRKRGTEFNFSIVNPDKHSARYNMREIGTTISGPRGLDDLKTLLQCKFEVGDFIDVAITVPSGPINRSNISGRDGGFNSAGRRPVGSGNFGRYRD